MLNIIVSVIKYNILGYNENYERNTEIIYLLIDCTSNVSVFEDAGQQYVSDITNPNNTTTITIVTLIEINGIANIIKIWLWQDKSKQRFGHCSYYARADEEKEKIIIFFLS